MDARKSADEKASSALEAAKKAFASDVKSLT
jgi:hypothetical protein